MKNLTLRNKLFLNAALILGIVIFSQLFGAISINRLSNSYREVAEVNLPIITALEEIKFAGSRLISSTNEVILNAQLNLEEENEEGEGEEAQVEEAIEDYTNALATLHLQLDIGDSEDNEFLDEIESSGNHLVELANTIIELQEAGAPIEEIAEAREEFESAEGLFLAAIQVGIDHEQEELAEGNEAVDNQLTFSDIALTVSTFVILAVILLLSFWLYQSVSKPVSHLQQVALGLRSGNLAQRITSPSSDEIGVLGQTFNQMADSIQNQVSALEAAKAEAERSNQVKSAFLASMSHELRTPLNAIINFTTFVAEGDMGDVNEDQQETLRQVITSSKHLLSLINDVLDMSKIEAGSLRLFVVDNVNIQNILTDVQKMGESLIKDKPIQMESQIAADLPLIRGDRQRVQQIFLNIMSNACKFTEEGKITLKAHQQDDKILISIQDTGEGIDPKDHVTVFESFRQTDSGLRQGGGTGLGMPISKSLAEAHGGKLWLESQTGHGSTFFVSLPIQAAHLSPTLAGAKA